MSGKSHISVRTKKILLGTGIVFGTVLVFVVSFFISFSLIVNPISFNAFGGDEVTAENEELKGQVQSLEDELEYLNATVEKYKANASAPVIETEENTVVTPSNNQGGTSGNSTSVTQPDTSEEEQTWVDDETVEEDFAPETVTTPEGGFEPEVEPDVTVIDISE
ncbi:MAG: hypothetical protein J6Q10_02480 [Clostridia bacterium]|nr:hypothetical protein [Clostridia bacterium]